MRWGSVFLASGAIASLHHMRTLHVLLFVHTKRVRPPRIELTNLNESENGHISRSVTLAGAVTNVPLSPETKPKKLNVFHIEKYF